MIQGQGQGNVGPTEAGQSGKCLVEHLIKWIIKEEIDN